MNDRVRSLKEFELKIAMGSVGLYSVFYAE